jgi:hypothetical protein
MVDNVPPIEIKNSRDTVNRGTVNQGFLYFVAVYNILLLFTIFCCYFLYFVAVINFGEKIRNNREDSVAQSGTR